MTLIKILADFCTTFGYFRFLSMVDLVVRNIQLDVQQPDVLLKFLCTFYIVSVFSTPFLGPIRLLPIRVDKKLGL